MQESSSNAPRIDKVTSTASFDEFLLLKCLCEIAEAENEVASTVIIEESLRPEASKWSFPDFLTHGKGIQLLLIWKCEMVEKGGIKCADIKWSAVPRALRQIPAVDERFTEEECCTYC
ncbi:hypothetical protein ACTXT7_012082 [Hymenolepis weldensis]